MKKIIWILVFIGVLFGGYMILPEYPHNLLKSIVQPIVESNASARITQVKNLQNKELNANYETILESQSKNAFWIYTSSEKSEDGLEHVIFYGRGISLNLKDFTNVNGMLYTDATVKIDFVITNNNVDIIPYVDGNKLYLDKSVTNYKETNDKLKSSIFTQMMNGVQSE